MRSLSWLATRRGWLLYGLAWSAFGAAYMAMFMLEQAPVAHAADSALRVVVTAALLGVATVAIVARVRPPFGPVGIGAHVVAGVLYPVLWVSSVAASRAVDSALRTGVLTIAFPQPSVIVWHLVAGVLVYATIVATTYSIENARNAERARREAEYRRFTAQLNPHLLFNTLQSVMSLIRSDPAAAQNALDHFAELLRRAIRVHGMTRDLIPFGEEWGLAMTALELEKLRLGDRLRVDAERGGDVDEIPVPAYVLQPLVENAVRHGIAPRAEGGVLTLRATRQGARLRIEVHNDAGTGRSPDPEERGHGIGIQAVRERLAHVFGERADMVVDDTRGGRFTVRLALPIRAIDA